MGIKNLLGIGWEAEIDELTAENLKLSWKALGPGQLAKSEYGYYLTYRNIDPESRVVRWYAKFEPRSSHFLKQEKWSQSQFFFSLEDAQLFCEEHAQAFEP
jgi:hypothetical protein